MLERLARLRQSVACLVVWFGLLGASRGMAETWREVQSPHFRVVTDGSEHDGRQVAKEFEQMRSVFAVRFKNAALETGAPLLVIAVRESGLHALGPVLWKGRDRIAGEFFRGWERQYAMVRLDTFGDLNQAVVFHEYAHSVLHANVHWLPTWLDEGMAEFYGYTRFQGDRIYVGAPSIRLRHLLSEPRIPLMELLAANGRTYSKDERREDLFYGESWSVVHYMTFGPEMGGGAKLNSFIALLEKGTSQKEAFEQTFGDPHAFEEKLFRYLSGFTLTAGVLPPMQAFDEKAFPTKVLTVAEADYEIGSFEIGAHEGGEGKIRLEAAEAADPSLAGPHEELGFVAWRSGHDEEAKTEWQRAVSADPTCYRAAFALLMSRTPLKLQDKQQLQQTRQALEEIEKKAPKFAPALVETALVQWRLGDMNAAYKAALQAEKLEPWRAGYHLLNGYILLQSRPTMAEAYARSVASRWPGSDHDEAVDLWNLIPGKTRSAEAPLTFALPSDATVARGTIVSSSCDKSGLSLVLQPNDPKGAALTVATNGRYESGFSDTLWVGEDHYTTCFHLAGLPAVLAYKAEGPTGGTLMVLEVRDDLPTLTSPVIEAEASPATSSTSHP